MRRTFALVLLILTVAVPASVVGQTTRPVDADELATQVTRAHGIDAWPKVTRLQFTFNVEQDGKQVLSAKHDWDLAAGTDTVTWGGKTVAVNLASPGPSDDEKAAFQRWTNDSYWLLAPLKLMDGGVTRAYKGEQQLDGKTYQVLHLSFAGVGLTPGDQYNLYINPQTKRLEAWDYMPSPDKKTTATWAGYQSVGGLTLATDHVMGNRRIRFTDLSAQTRD